MEVSFGGRSKSRGPKHQPEVWSWLDDGPQIPVVRWCVSCTCGFSDVVGDQEEAEGLATGHSNPEFQKKIEEEKGPEILVTSKGQEVEVIRSDEESLKILGRDHHRREIEGIKQSSFAFSLIQQWDAGKGKKNRLSEKQRAWVHFLAGEVEERARERKLDEMVGPELSEEGFPRLVEMMVGAKERLKFPRIVVQMEDGAIRLNVAGERAKIPGSLNVTSDGAFEDREWYGRIHPDGRFEGSRNCPEWVLGALVEFESDPAKAAAIQGQKFGACCFCGRELITNDSVRVGYGPVCADKYGLPWGEEEGEG